MKNKQKNKKENGNGTNVGMEKFASLRRYDPFGKDGEVTAVFKQLVSARRQYKQKPTEQNKQAMEELEDEYGQARAMYTPTTG
ncbi:hypothetical protein KAW38_02015 [Candidatus Micrarchaeota archaeon]|nr:hypothetical protein [Candidatus Micrarchaeota archaeon]